MASQAWYTPTVPWGALRGSNVTVSSTYPRKLTLPHSLLTSEPLLCIQSTTCIIGIINTPPLVSQSVFFPLLQKHGFSRKKHFAEGDKKKTRHNLRGPGATSGPPRDAATPPHGRVGQTSWSTSIFPPLASLPSLGSYPPRPGQGMMGIRHWVGSV